MWGMAYSIPALVPDVDDLLALAPEEAGLVVLKHLVSLGPTSSPPNRSNFGLGHVVADYPSHRHREAMELLMQGWAWLEREGLLAPDPGQGGEWRLVTAQGKELAQRSDLSSYRSSDLLPKDRLHPSIARQVYGDFLRGEYDIAVLRAFKQVEVAVRDASGSKNADLGVPLMRKTFDVKNGPLSDPGAEPGERQALSDLFAGALGVYKNPQTRRTVALSDSAEAVEVILLASHLLTSCGSWTPAGQSDEKRDPNPGAHSGLHNDCPALQQPA